MTLHWLRRSYATHLLEAGTDLRYIQEILGHSSSRTMEIYTHISTKNIQQIQSPFDTLSKLIKFILGVILCHESNNRMLYLCYFVAGINKFSLNVKSRPHILAHLIARHTNPKRKPKEFKFLPTHKIE